MSRKNKNPGDRSSAEESAAGRNGCRAVGTERMIGEGGTLEPSILAGFLGVDEKQVVNVRDLETRKTLDRYLDIKRTGKVITGLKFSQLERTTGMWFWDGEVKVLMPVTEHRSYRPQKPEEAYVAAMYLDRLYNVMVMDVNEEEQVVRVSYYEAQEAVRGLFEAEINKSLEKGVPYVTKAVVNNVQALYDEKGDVKRYFKLQLSVGGVGTNGYLWIEDWSQSYTPTFEGIVEKGDVIDVAVIEKLGPKHTYKDHVGYRCTRKPVEPSPWKGIEEKISQRTLVDVQCIDPPNEKHRNYFWGVIKGLEGISIPCYLPKRGGISVYKGCSYRGFVSSLNPAERILRVQIPSEEQS